MGAMSNERDVQVSPSIERERYHLTVDGALAGFVTYHDRAGVRALPHTEIDEAYRGQGLAATLIGAALDDIRDRGLGLLPLCPAVRSYVAKHREYVELVPQDRRAEFDLA